MMILWCGSVLLAFAVEAAADAPAERSKDLRVEETIVGGKSVYRSGE